MSCNTNRNVDITTAFAAVANPACGQFFNPGNFSGEQVIYDTAYKDLINNFGIPINYYVNTFNLTGGADPLYGEHPTSKYNGPYELLMYVELNENAINLTKFGFASDDELTGYLHIQTFASKMSSINYESFAQSVEPKSGDIIELTSLGCDRPNGRGPKWFEITERVDQDISTLNPLLGHYVYRVRAKRYERSYEPGLSGERVNEQVYENSLYGVLSSNIPGVSASEDKSYPFDIDNESKVKVLDMSVNNTDIYGSYY